MKILSAALALLLLSACVPDQKEHPGWTVVGKTPNGGNIYKKHDDGERVTYYATQANHDGFFIVSVVKDQEGK